MSTKFFGGESTTSQSIDEATLQAAIAEYLEQQPIQSASNKIQVLYRDANWDAANVDGIGGAFWSGKGGNGATGAIEFGWYVVPTGASRLYLPLHGGGYKVGALGLIAFLNQADEIKGSKTADQVIIRPGTNDPLDGVHFKYRFPIELSEVGLAVGDTFKIRVEDNQGFDTYMAVLGFVPEMVIFGV